MHRFLNEIFFLKIRQNAVTAILFIFSHKKTYFLVPG
jgi:hypothetical protein